MAKNKKDQAEPSSPRFSIRIPGFSGVHPIGLKFQDNLGHTDDPTVVEAARQQGFEVMEVAEETPPQDAA